MREATRRWIHWAIAVALLLHLAAMLFLDQSFLPGALP